MTFTVTAIPEHTLEAPVNGAGLLSPVTVSGWAIDASAPTGTGVDNVHVWTYPNLGTGAPAYFVGAATYGGNRADVAASRGERFRYSGYTMSSSGFLPGQHLLAVSSRSSHTLAWTTRTTGAFVDIPTTDLTITRSGTGTGAITAAGLSCPGGATTQALPCGASYPLGTVVTVTAVPDPGSTFAGWIGGCTGTTPCVQGMNGSRHVTAMFSKVPGNIATRYYHTDVVGSVRAITDEVGSVVIRHDYAPFGEDTLPATGDPRRFAGKELDPETVMQYFEARYYRNTWGRFSAVDPLHVSTALKEPQRWNRYAYAGNNPLKNVDPSGLSYYVCFDGCRMWHVTWEEFQSSMAAWGFDLYNGRDGGAFESSYGVYGTYDYYCNLVCDYGPRPGDPPDDDEGDNGSGGTGGQGGDDGFQDPDDGDVPTGGYDGPGPGPGPATGPDTKKRQNEGPINNCGSGFAVPNQLMGYNIDPAWVRHDDCYSKPGPGGKVACDIQMSKDMAAIIRRNSTLRDYLTLRVSAARFLVGTYFWGVTIGGWPAYFASE